jgi:hypothetical protein
MQTNPEFESCMKSIDLATKEVERCEKETEVATCTLEQRKESLIGLLRPVIDRAIELCNSECSRPGRNSKYRIVPEYEVQLNLENNCFDLNGKLRNSSGDEPDYELDCLGSSTDERIPEIFHSIISQELSREGICFSFNKLNFPGYYLSF